MWDINSLCHQFMNEKVLHTLEFDKIRLQLSKLCVSDTAKNAANKLSPVKDPDKINILQKNTSDAVSRILKYKTPPFINPANIFEYTDRLKVGSSLYIPEFLHILSLLKAAKRIKSMGSGSGAKEIIDSLSDYFTNLEPNSELIREIESIIISESEISDNASPQLYSIRNNIQACKNKVHEKLQSMLISLKDYLQDSVITQRSGRYCLPILATHKGKVPGMVHDQSSSGQTLFIEPMPIVELNNRLRELILEEKEEVNRILADLSLKIGEHTEDLENNYRLITRLDFIFAKAALALDMNAMQPNIVRNGGVNLKSARHPLISKDICVPIDIRLGEEFNLLIITGPNTGGKTVSLKTLGLLSIMAQCGLHIPAKEESRLPIFSYIGADIGDEQSIEQSLSTFSSHITNIKRIIGDMEKFSFKENNCLLLFDELCAGTDPKEGAVLATSILEYLHQKNIYTMATTHYSELKTYAIATKGVENASMEFDITTLSPTYHLSIGVPGKSNAFAISEKLGIPGEIIENARKKLTARDISVENLFSELEIKRAELEREKEKIISDKDEIDKAKALVKAKEEKLNRQKDDILNKANQKAYNILRDAKESADLAIRNINKYGGISPDMSMLEKTRSGIGKKLKNRQEKSIAGTDSNIGRGKLSPDKIKIGDLVYINSLNTQGIVQALPNEKKELEVQMGILRSRVKLNDLSPVNEDTASNKDRLQAESNSLSLSKASSISSEIKLIGMTGDEAEMILSKYLDDAYISRLSSVRIVHGKGTGVLRQVVSEHLRKHPLIKEYHLAEYGEGDSGVTIAHFT